MIVLDTHVMIWVAGGERKLGRKARALIDRHWQAGMVAVSALSFWESGLLQVRRRLSLPVPARQWRDELLAAGYRNVRRYQLGIPVWRALGGITEIEPEGAQYVRENDRTAMWIDAREPEEFRSKSIPNARNLPLTGVKPGKDVGEVKKAKDDGRLPMEDHNTRIIVFGRDGAQAKAVAEALAREAFHNVSYFAGPFERLRTAAGR